MTTLLLQLLLHLFIESTKGLLVLLLLVSQGPVALALTCNHLFLGDARILQILHTDQRLQTEQPSAIK